MIRKLKGNLLESKAEALVNTVNTVGVMGKGIALQFKKAYPNNFRVYKEACDNNEVSIGKVLIVKDESMLGGEKFIINFPTKKHWRQPSKYEYIERGMQSLVAAVKEHKIKSIALPPLGSGNGGLHWYKVSQIIESHLSELPELYVELYEPSNKIKEVLKKEKVKLTPARAMLLAVMYDLVRNGEMVSEFAGEKVCYFLQRFGAEDIFKLDFKPNFYGPYSGKVRHVLYALNGSYVMGYQDKDTKPFEDISLLMDTEQDVMSFLENLEDSKPQEIVFKTKSFLNGLYSSFSLELLSTVDYIQHYEGKSNMDEIRKIIGQWSSRKSKLFGNDRYLEIAMSKLKEAKLSYETPI